MGLFHRNKSILTSGALEGITDVHSHLLPGVDDGASSYTASTLSLQWLFDSGVRRMYLTPHLMSDYPGNTRASLTSAFRTFTQRLGTEQTMRLPMLKLCGEYMLEPTFEAHLADGLLTYSGSYALIETSYMTPPVGMSSIIDRMVKSGYYPVLAHPERYNYMDEYDYSRLRDRGVLFQLNCLSLTGFYGSLVRRKATDLLEDGYYSFAGSDIHRLEQYADAFNVKTLSGEQSEELRKLFVNNQQLW
jgi:tyrosine-protein phosphatase YwqE